MSTLSPLRRAILAVGSLLSLGVIAMAVGSLVDSMGHTSERRDSHFRLPGNQLTVHSGAGDIDLVASADQEVHVRADLEYGVVKPTLRIENDGNLVRLDAACSGWLPFQHCEVHFTVAVPDGTSVNARSSGGDLTATNLTGTLNLSSSAGDVSATNVHGSVNLRSTAGDVNASHVTGTATLHSSAGDVNGMDLDAAKVDASSTAGDVFLAFASNAFTGTDGNAIAANVTATSSAGDVNVELPLDSARYDIEVRSRTGGTQNIDPDLQRSDSKRKIAISSTAGDVNVLEAPAG